VNVCPSAIEVADLPTVDSASVIGSVLALASIELVSIKAATPLVLKIMVENKIAIINPGTQVVAAPAGPTLASRSPVPQTDLFMFFLRIALGFVGVRTPFLPCALR